jgi:nitrogen permease regulator 3-like protein
MVQALQCTTLPLEMKKLYEAIKSSSMAHLTINSLPLELQLPPYLDFLLHPGEDDEQRPYDDSDEGGEHWGKEMSVGWRLPSLAPWKSLLLLDGPGDAGAGIGGLSVDPDTYLKSPHTSPEDRRIAEGLFRFLDVATVTISCAFFLSSFPLLNGVLARLADMADLLEWDLEAQVFPIVRWLVHHRRAKIVDVVHEGLKTVFSLPPTFDQP